MCVARTVNGLGKHRAAIQVVTKAFFDSWAMGKAPGRVVFLVNAQNQMIAWSFYVCVDKKEPVYFEQVFAPGIGHDLKRHMWNRQKLQGTPKEGRVRIVDDTHLGFRRAKMTFRKDVMEDASPDPFGKLHNVDAKSENN